MEAQLSPGLALHLAQRIRTVRRRYRKRLARCRERFSETAVHELRIETRRLLALLDLLDLFNAGGARTKLRKAFKKRLDAFDDLRDTQVQLRLLQPMWRKFSEAARLEKILHRAENRLVSRLARKIQAAKTARLNRRLKRVEKMLCPRGDAVSGAADEQQACAVLRTAFGEVSLLRQRIQPRNTETIHRMRVAFKRFRYMCELLTPVARWVTPPLRKRMKAFQDQAGVIQDLEVLLARLALAVRGEELKPAFAAGLRADLLRQRRRAIATFLARLDNLSEFKPPPICNETLPSPSRRRG